MPRTLGRSSKATWWYADRRFRAKRGKKEKKKKRKNIRSAKRHRPLTTPWPSPIVVSISGPAMECRDTRSLPFVRIQPGHAGFLSLSLLFLCLSVHLFIYPSLSIISPLFATVALGQSLPLPYLKISSRRDCTFCAGSRTITSDRTCVQ